MSVTLYMHVIWFLLYLYLPLLFFKNKQITKKKKILLHEYIFCICFSWWTFYKKNLYNNFILHALSIQYGSTQVDNERNVWLWPWQFKTALRLNEFKQADIGLSRGQLSKKMVLIWYSCMGNIHSLALNTITLTHC